MATAFSKQERDFIEKKLKEVARDCLGRYGVRKTTVDQLVEMTGISKGSFYNFYSGKEQLFFKVLEEYQEAMINELLSKFEMEESIGVARFTEAIYDLYQNVRQSFIMTIILNDELEYLMRKVPQEVLSNHHSLDTLLVEKIFSHVQLKANVSAELVSTALRGIFMSMLHVNEVGEQYFDEALKLLINGLALQVLEVADNDEGSN